MRPSPSVRRAHTLAEVLLVAGLFGLMMTTILGVWSTLRTVERARAGSWELAREQALLTRRLDDLLSAAAFVVWDAPDVILGSQLYRFPGLPSTSWETLVAAIPEPGGGTVTVVALSAQPHTPPDPRNPQALDLVLYEKPAVPCPRPAPDLLDLALATGGNERRYAVYLEPGSLSVRWSVTDRFASFDLTYRKVSERGPVTSGSLQLMAELRNAP